MESREDSDRPTSAGDDELARLVLARGLASAADIESCLREQSVDRARGRAPQPLAQILLARRLVSTGDLAELLRSAGAGPPRTGETVLDWSIASSLPESLAGPPPVISLERSARVGRYEVVREVARGGMGAVYEAYDPELKRRIALKVLLDPNPSPNRIARLRREAELAGRLRHPHLVAVHEVGNDGAVHFIAMDYVEGRTLGQALPDLDLDRRITCLEQVADAVACAHAHGVIHRDLKPANVLVDGEGRAVVTDWGLARWDEDEVQLTRTGAILGTPYSMSPEQVLGRRSEVGPRSDVWALGVLLYEMLTDTKPFAGNSAAEVHQAILHREPARPGRVRAGTLRPLEAICLAALEKDRSLRYADAGEFLADLRRWRAGRAVTARSTGLTRVQRRWARSRWAMPAAIALTGFLTLDAWWLASELERRRDFGAARDEAVERFGSEDWEGALLAAEKALTLDDDDDEVAGLAGDCRSRIEAARIRAVSARRLRERFEALDRRVQDARVASYLSEVDLAVSIDRVRTEFEDLHAQLPLLADPEEALVPLGLAAALAGERDRAIEYLERSRRSRPDDPLVLHRLARLFLEGAVEGSLRADPPAAAEATALAWRRRALAALPAPDDEPKDIARDLVAVHRLLAQERAAEAAQRCRRGLERFGRELGSEEYWYLLGWTLAGDDRVAAWEKALARRPHDLACRRALGVERARRGERDRARRDLEAVTASHPADSVAREWLERLDR